MQSCSALRRARALFCWVLWGPLFAKHLLISSRAFFPSRLVEAWCANMSFSWVSISRSCKSINCGNTRVVEGLPFSPVKWMLMSFLMSAISFRFRCCTPRSSVLVRSASPAMKETKRLNKAPWYCQSFIKFYFVSKRIKNSSILAYREQISFPRISRFLSCCVN